MALEIKDTPNVFSSVHGDLIYTVLDAGKVSDPDTYPNFKYIGDVYVGATLVARIRTIQNPLTGVGVFNIGQIVRNYMATTFSPLPNTKVAQSLGLGEFYLKITMKFGEEYDFESYYNITTDSERTFYNHYNGRLYGTTSSLPNYANNVASRRPTNSYVQMSSQFNLIPYFATTDGSVPFVVTPVPGSFLNSSFTGVANEMSILNVSPAAINAIQPGTITSATQYYTVQIGGEAYRFNLTCEPMFRNYPLHFLNKYGGFETAFFSKVSRTTYDIDKKDFAKLPYTIDENGSVVYFSTNGVINETRSVYSSQFKEKMELNSDLLTDADYLWLGDLIKSPLVYLEDSGYFFPVVITDTDYEEKKVVNDELSNLAIKLEFGEQYNAQYR